MLLLLLGCCNVEERHTTRRYGDDTFILVLQSQSAKRTTGPSHVMQADTGSRLAGKGIGFLVLLVPDHVLMRALASQDQSRRCMERT